MTHKELNTNFYRLFFVYFMILQSTAQTRVYHIFSITGYTRLLLLNIFWTCCAWKRLQLCFGAAYCTIYLDHKQFYMLLVMVCQLFLCTLCLPLRHSTNSVILKNIMPIIHQMITNAFRFLVPLYSLKGYRLQTYT